jgi:hypothetical protein
MLTDQDFRDFVEYLTNESLSDKSSSLKALCQMPSRDARLLPYLEGLLYDKRPCILGFPLIFGEVRWLAAQALAAERAALGINERIYLPNVVRPIDTKGYTKARKAAQVDFRSGVEGILENLAILRDMGYLPMSLLELPRAKTSPERQPTSAKPVEQSRRQLALVPA